MKPNKTQIFFVKTFPSVKKFSPKRSLVIFDQILLKNSDFEKFIFQFPESYAVTSGETLKDLEQFPVHFKNILEKSNRLSERPLQILAVGGGSVGDFAGFVASTLKRGVDLIHMPSTWLAAVDSAHGGKTALNAAGIKNQIGTFHSAKEVYHVQSLLFSQGNERAEDVLGEVLKMALLTGGELFAKVSKLKSWSSKELWALLPMLVQAKYKVVKQDPFEKKGIRHLLNLGHTMGHVFESELSMPHGQAVLAGLGFALQYSLQKKLLTEKQLAKIRSSFLFNKIPLQENQSQLLSQLRDADKHLSQDKKRATGHKLRFVFVKSPGKISIQAINLKDIASEVQRQAR